jgi:hypothetical protein
VERRRGTAEGRSGSEAATEESVCGEGSGGEGGRRQRRNRRERSGEGRRGRRSGSVWRGNASDGDGKARERACGSGVDEACGDRRTARRAARLVSRRVERRRRRERRGGIWFWTTEGVFFLEK